MLGWKLHERDEGRGSQNHDLVKRLVVELEYVLLQNLLVVHRMGLLVHHLPILPDLKDARLDSTPN